MNNESQDPQQTGNNRTQEPAPEGVKPGAGEAAAETPPVMEVTPAEEKPRRKGGATRRAGRIFLQALLVIGAGAALAAWRDYWLPYVWPGAPVNVPYMVTAAEYEGRGITKDGAQFTAAFEIEVFEKQGWKKIPLVPSTVAIVDSALPDGAYLYLADGMYSMLTRRAGKMQASVTFSAAAREAEGKTTLEFSRIPSVTASLTAVFPREDVDVTIHAAQSVKTVKTNGMTRATAALPDRAPVRITWEPALPEIARGEPKVYSETQTLLSISEGLILGQARVAFSVLQAPTRELKLAVPAGVSVLEITGPNIRDWRVKAGRLSIQLEKEVIGLYSLGVKYEASPSLVAGRLAVPAVTGSGVEREKGEIGIVSLTNVELRNSRMAGAHTIDVRDLPSEIMAMTTQPILLAYQYLRPDFEVELEVSQPREVSVLMTVIDRVHFTLMQTHDGKRIVRAVYDVRNNRNQFLRVQLPEGAELWSASVAGRSTQPARDAEGRVLVPLVRSQGAGGRSAYPVELVYVETDARPDARGRGTVKVMLPACTEPIMHMMVSLFVPGEGRYCEFGGSLRPVEQFTALGGRELAAPGAAHIQKALQQAVERPASAGAPAAGEMDIRIPAAGQVFRLEKILVLKDAQWFEFEYSRLN